MSLDYLVLNIKFDINKDSFDVSGNVNEEGRAEIVSTFLRTQMGAEKDTSKVIKRDIYNIEMKWYPEDDRIEASYNTGNKGLREGILMHYLKSLG